MKLLSYVRNQLGFGDELSFYNGKNVVEVEWWISYACEFPDLCWGRLRTFSDGNSDAAFQEKTTYGFDDRENAGYFLSEDEYVPFARLNEGEETLIGAKASQMSPPVWNEMPRRFKYYGTY